MPYFRINGRDIAHYILQDGIQLSENDVDSPKSGRALDALMHRGKVAEKKRADIKLWPVKKETLDWILPMLRNQYFSVETDLYPGYGGRLQMEMYNSTRKYGVTVVDTQGVTWYMNTSFNIIQR